MTEYEKYWNGLTKEEKKNCLLAISKIIYTDSIENRRLFKNSLKYSFDIEDYNDQNLEYYFQIYNHIRFSLDYEEDKNI